jgi:hypothetical protein
MVDDGDAFHDFFPYLCVWVTGRIDAKMRKLVLVSIYAPVEQLQSSKEKTAAVDLQFRNYPMSASVLVERPTELI